MEVAPRSRKDEDDIDNRVDDLHVGVHEKLRRGEYTHHQRHRTATVTVRFRERRDLGLPLPEVDTRLKYLLTELDGMHVLSVQTRMSGGCGTEDAEQETACCWCTSLCCCGVPLVTYWLPFYLRRLLRKSVGYTTTVCVRWLAPPAARPSAPAAAGERK